MFDGFDYWNDALNNMRESNRKRAQKLIDKYGLPIDRNSLEGGDEYEYDMVKDYVDEFETENYNFDYKEENLGDKIAEYVANSDAIRKTAIFMQGINNSYANPITTTMRLNNYINGKGFETGLERIEPNDNFERGVETAGEFIYELVVPAPEIYKATNYVTKSSINGARNIVDRYRLGKAYDEVLDNPFIGKADDLLVRSKIEKGRNVDMLRGGAISDSNGNLITQGKELKRQIGIKRNYGMNKEIHTHNMSKKEVQEIPKILRKFEPDEITSRGQKIYKIKSKDGKIRKIVTSPIEKNGEKIECISSDYWVGMPKYSIKKWNK